ncbi:unnamed protein product [Rotaria sordida]|uniref:G-protein coupled receptors family 1 profile domain-containing protein n=1 Tax=Rotaria sordida TaxID=392033 RepID=A0A813ZB31_9BILA|nr:unnamed protein product [Rotaria sordida]
MRTQQYPLELNSGKKIAQYTYYGLFPILISSSFSLLAYQNVRQLVRRQIPIERRRLDRQMTAMIFARVITFVILVLPYTIFRIYTLNVNVSPVDILPYAINQLVSAIVSSLLIWIYALNFYIFLASSSRFRRQVKYFLVKKCWQSLKRWYSLNRTQVHPLDESPNISGIELVQMNLDHKQYPHSNCPILVSTKPKMIPPNIPPTKLPTPGIILHVAAPIADPAYEPTKLIIVTVVDVSI